MVIDFSNFCLPATIVAVLAVGTVHADNEYVIARCARIASTGDRILCLENALRQLSADSEQSDSAEAETTIAQQVSPAAIVSESGAKPEPEIVIAGQVIIENNGTDERHDTNIIVAPAVAPTSEKSSESMQEIKPDDLDALETEIEQIGAVGKKVANEEPDSIDVRVVKVSKDPYGKLVFTTAGGQVWYQTDKHSARYRDIPFEATIRKAAAGSFLLRPRSGGVSIRVKRRK